MHELHVFKQRCTSSLRQCSMSKADFGNLIYAIVEKRCKIDLHGGEKKLQNRVRHSAQCFILFGFGQEFSFRCIPKQKLLYIFHKSIAMKYLTMFKKK